MSCTLFQFPWLGVEVGVHRLRLSSLCDALKGAEEWTVLELQLKEHRQPVLSPDEVGARIILIEVKARNAQYILQSYSNRSMAGTVRNVGSHKYQT